MPAEGIRRIELACGSNGRLLVQTIAQTFGVSPEAARHRLNTYRTRRAELLPHFMNERN